MTKVVIEVSTICSFDQLHPDDQDEQGNPRIQGEYPFTVYGSDPIEEALDMFHQTIPIKCLDDFFIHPTIVEN